MRGTLVVCVCAIFALACGTSESKKEAPAAAPVEPKDKAGSAPAPAADGKIWLHIDGKKHAAINPAAFRQNSDLLAVPGVPPIASWTLLKASDGTNSIAVPDVATKFPDHVVRLYVAQDDKLSIGVFPPGTPSAGPVQKFRGVKVIEVVTNGSKPEPQGPQAPPATVALEREGKPAASIQIGGSPPVLTAPDGDPAKGWALAALLGDHLGAGEAPALTLVAKGESIDIPEGTLRDKGQVLFIKLNRRGQVRFRWYAGTTKDAEVKAELRGVSTIRLK